MRLIDAHTAEQYLRDTSRLAANDCVQVREMSGGVSNIVLYVKGSRPDQVDFVIKQARAQLRVADPWFCSVERIRREVQVLRACAELLSGGTQVRQAKNLQSKKLISGRTAITPRILFEDTENYLFAMDAAPSHQMWKTQLLAGTCEPDVAVAAGNLLATLHSTSWNDSTLNEQLQDRQFFHDLRVDPYYLQVARVHPQLRQPIEALVDSLAVNRTALVHGDFSPKNLLVYEGGLMLIDCEVGHFGDPAFDLGFFLTHLFLKAVRTAPNNEGILQLLDSFWLSYRQHMVQEVGQDRWMALTRRTVTNFLGCTLARIDGKSKVDYLSEPQRAWVRDFCLAAFPAPCASWEEMRKVLGGRG